MKLHVDFYFGKLKSLLFGNSYLTVLEKGKIEWTWEENQGKVVTYPLLVERIEEKT